jgi:uncharacterized membrane-anchored protein
MQRLPPDHPQRVALSDEVHARPPEPLQTPTLASHLSVLIDADERAAERAHLAQLCAALGAPPPRPDVAHTVISRDGLRVKWERHGEFSGWTVLLGVDAATGFERTAAEALPPGWLERVPGRTLMAAHALLVRGGPQPADATQLAGWFGPGVAVVGSQVADGAGQACTDFRLHDGWSRWVLIDRGLTPRQAGRVLQRLFEIEVYRLLALLALPVAQAQLPAVQKIEDELAGLTAGIARDDGRDEALLTELTRLAAEVEQSLSHSRFRFGACRAYSQLVAARTSELREGRLPGMQTLDEFLTRRFSPAVATCAMVSQRLHELSDRVAQASSLLATRVGIVRERQNQALLASMERRARLQLRLQQTVEGLSVAAIAYYAAGLVGYAAKAAKAAGLPIHPDVAVGLALPVVALLVWRAVRRARRHLHDDG